MKNRNIFIKLTCVVLSLIIVIFSLCSCGSQKQINGMKDAVAYNGIYESASFDDSENNYNDSVSESQSNNVDSDKNKNVEQTRKLIKTASITLESKKFDETISIINKQAKALKGYIAESRTEGSNERHTYITVKIPAAALDDFLKITTEAATVIEQETSISDITSNYVDTESHIAALKAEQTALLEILKKAENVDSTLQIYNQLSEVNYQLENYERQLKSYDNSVEYATITIAVNEVERETPQDGSFFNELKTKLINNLNKIKNVCRAIIIWLLSSIPYFIIIAIFILFIIIRKKSKRSKNKKQ